MYRPLFASIVAAACAAACSDASTMGPPDDEPATLTVDASRGWAFVRLGTTAQVVSVTNPSQSQDWDIAFNAVSVMLNGGGIGPGQVTAHCLCDNSGATPQQVLSMTPASELSKFVAATSDRIPTAESAWQADSLAQVMTGWYRYDMTTHTIAPAADRAWKVRLAARPGADTAYAKVRVVGIADGTQQHAGRVTLEYAVQPRRGVPMGDTRTAVLDVTGGPVAFDLVSGSVATGGGAWDIRLSGYTMRLNGGVSGTAGAGAALATDAFGAIADASDLVPQQYRSDGAGGVFSAHPWYLYDIAGDHQISPTFQVYLVRRGTAVYKVQITGYYNATGDARFITVRYARLAE